MTVPWEDNTQRVRKLLDQGKEARDAGRLEEAAGLFRQAYELEPSAFAASRYLHCMRRQGREMARAAVSFAREPVEQWPMETWLIREYVWAIYDGFLKANGASGEEEVAPAAPRPEFEVMVKAARRILKLSSEELPRTRTIFAICRAARERGEWATVMEFIQTLDPESLSDEAREQAGRTVPSDRQQWLSFITRACLEMGRYEECRSFAREGMERYAPVMFFPRWHALAQVRGGEVEVGLEELKAVERRFFAPWYVRREIAEACEQLGQDAEAWEWYCAAARSAGEMRSRAAMLARMGQLLERLDRGPLALDHLLLAWTLAAHEERWEKLAEQNREQVEGFLQQHAAKLGVSPELPPAPPEMGPLLDRCRQAWIEGP